MRNRFSVLAFSLLVLVVTLAGLMGILDILPQPVGSGSSPDGDLPASSTTGKKPGGPLPESVTEKLTASISPAFSLKGPMPPHIPLFEAAGATNTEYLKSKTASFFNGREWEKEDDTRYEKYEGETLLPSVVSYNRQLVDDISITSLIKVPDGIIPVPTSLYPVHVASPAPLLYFPEEQVFHSEEGFPDAYTFRTAHYDFDNPVLLDAEVDSQGKYLQLPAGITQRTRELARTITRDSETPYQKAKAIEDYIKSNCVYDFDYERAPEGWEPNDWFLVEDKRGVCANFNSAFVILCRAAGIPARLVSGFRITPQIENQVVYQDQNHNWSEVKFKDLGWYTFDATGRFDHLPTVTEITSVGPIIRKGHSFNIQGTVQTERGLPAKGVMVEVFINDQKDTECGILIGKGIASNGRFDIEATIPAETDVGDYHVLAHCLKSIRYMESWSDPIIKVVTATNLSLQVPSRVKVQELILLQGSLTEEFGEPLSGQGLDIYLDGVQAAQLTTSEDGQFAWERAFNEAGAYTVKVSFQGKDYYLESSQEAGFQVLTPTAIKLNVTDSDTEEGVLVNKQILIVGSLFEEMTDIPLQGQEIEILINGEPAGDKIVTDEEGSFEIGHTFDEVGHYQIEAKFFSVPFYWESSARTDLEVFPAPGVSLWPYLIILLTLVLAGTGGFFIYRWQKQHQLLAVSATPSPSTTQVVPLPQREAPSHAISLTIEFPQIKNPFPDVWGLDDALEIVCHLSSPQGDGLAAKQLEVYIGSELIAQLTTDKNGTGKLDYTFTEKGQYALMVRVKEEPGDMDVSVRRTLRIVDYREEIVNLFEALVNWFRELGIEISMKSTPREIEYRVLNAGKSIPEKDMDKVVSCFEEADYSLHPINRSHYQAMYLAQRKIIEHGREFTRESARESAREP